MMRSKICPKIRVGTDTCCKRPKVSNNSLNDTASLLCTKSMWKLKSPAITRGSGHMTMFSRYDENSSKNTNTEELGGR